MKNIVLIRHGQSQGQTASHQGVSREDPSFIDCFLTSKGIKEAIQLRSNRVLNRYKFDLVCTSPLSRAISTCVLALGGIIEKEIREKGVASTPFIANADISEAGKGVPENKGRDVQVLLKDLSTKLLVVSPSTVCLDHIDFSMLPDSWPDIIEDDDKSVKKQKLEMFLKWIANREEEIIAVVCHYNVIRWMLNNSIYEVPNCVPIECVLTDDARLVLKSEQFEASQSTASSISGQGKDRKNKSKHGRNTTK